MISHCKTRAPRRRCRRSSRRCTRATRPSPRARDDSPTNHQDQLKIAEGLASSRIHSHPSPTSHELLMSRQLTWQAIASRMGIESMKDQVSKLLHIWQASLQSYKVTKLQLSPVTRRSPLVACHFAACHLSLAAPVACSVAGPGTPLPSSRAGGGSPTRRARWRGSSPRGTARAPSSSTRCPTG